MRLSCYIIDDEHSVEELVKFIYETPGLDLLGTAFNSLQGIQEISNGKIADLLFLNVDIAQHKGLNVANLIGPATNIIYTTAFLENGPEVSEENAVNYLLKPINYHRFLNVVSKVKLKKSGAVISHPFIFVKTAVKGKVKRITIAEISYVENIGKSVYIHTEKEKITTYQTLAELLYKLPDHSFSRIHQSYIVNHAFIRAIEYGRVRLSAELTIPISGTYRPAFKHKIGMDTLISKKDQSSG